MSKKNNIIVAYLNNQECFLHHSGVIFIPKIKAIIISDIHFEKASALNIKKISTIPLPSFDTHEILITLNKIFKIFDPKKIIFLGDTFHNLISAEYISEKYKKNIKDIINEFECIWIKGNHDVNKPSWLDVTPIDEHEEIGIVFRHITKFEDNEISGHYHLKTKIKTRDKSITGKCFIFNNKTIIMPSFGIFTGGLYLSEFLNQFSYQGKINIGFIYRNKIYNYNLKAVLK